MLLSLLAAMIAFGHCHAPVTTRRTPPAASLRTHSGPSAFGGGAHMVRSRAATLPRSLARVPRGGGNLEVAGHTAVGLWAFSSTVNAGRAKMDAVGCLITALFATLGGSTIRDLCLGRRVFWVRDGSYLATLGITSLVTFFLYPLIEYAARLERNELGLRTQRRTALQVLLELPDAMGMAFYSVYGAHIALHCCETHDSPAEPLVAVLMGLSTSCFGSFAADMMCQQPLKMLRAGHTLYTLPALLASATYTVWDTYFPGTAQSRGCYVAFAISFLLRMAAVTWEMTLPSWLEGGARRQGLFSRGNLEYLEFSGSAPS